MVFFSCDGCAEMLKKNQVDGHANRCRRGCASVSCVDCNVSFYGDDYRSHTSCLTEAERYEKSDAKRKTKKKKVSPQEQWMDLIRSSSCVESAPPHLRHYLQVMTSLDNVPRKEKQFRNFTANSLNLRGKKNAGETIVSDIWRHLSSLKEQQQREKGEGKADSQKPSEEPKSETAGEEGVSSSETSTMLSSSGPSELATSSSGTADVSNKREEDAETNDGGGEKDDKNARKESTDQKSVKKAMKKVLKGANKHSLSLKRLQKAVRKQLGIPKSGRRHLKELVRETIQNGKASKKKTIFILEGKQVRLEML